MKQIVSELVSYIGYKILDHYYERVMGLLHLTYDHFQALFFCPDSSAVSSVPSPQMTTCGWSVFLYSCHTQEREKSSSAFRGLSSEYALDATQLHEALFRCVQPIFQKAENRCAHMWF